MRTGGQNKENQFSCKQRYFLYYFIKYNHCHPSKCKIRGKENDNYVVEFSPTHIETKYGFPKSTARDHFNKLIEKGYLVRKNENSNMYDFYAEPENLKTQDNSVLPTRFDFGE